MTTRRRRLHIVVTCANRKRVPVPAVLHLRRTRGARPTQRAARGIERLAATRTEAISASDLYAGEHWDVARSLPAAARGFVNPKLWVASAGWGLIEADARIHPYSATFSPRHPDSVAASAAGNEAWWDALSSWEGPMSGAARSLTALVASHPRDRVLLVLSQAYLAACHADLRAALDRAYKGQVSVIAAGAIATPDLADVMMPADARLQHHVGGTRGGLNVRIAKSVLIAGLSDHRAMSEHLREQLAASPSLITYDRQRLSDAEVRTFIRSRLVVDDQVSHTRLLRALRDEGKACEQSRFAELFKSAQGSTP